MKLLTSITIWLTIRSICHNIKLCKSVLFRSGNTYGKLAFSFLVLPVVFLTSKNVWKLTELLRVHFPTLWKCFVLHVDVLSNWKIHFYVIMMIYTTCSYLDFFLCRLHLTFPCVPGSVGLWISEKSCSYDTHHHRPEWRAYNSLGL